MKLSFPIIALIVLLCPGLALATKPCQEPPCRDTSNRLQPELCRTKADWVAVGRLRNVRHHPKGDPLNKDFAEFELEVTQTEKGSLPQGSLRFKVGWCTNQTELPPKTDGLLRIYGSNRGDFNNPGYLSYLDLEPLE